MSEYEPRRPGRQKGQKYPRVKRPAGEQGRRHDMWLLDSHYEHLKRLGDGNASAGLRRLVDAIKMIS